MISAEALNDRIVETLKTIEDPELGVNIYDLGLIYDILIEQNRDVTITMTLTSVGCPVGELLVKQVKRYLSKLDEVQSIEVNLVFEPPWDPNQMSEEVRLELGML